MKELPVSIAERDHVRQCENGVTRYDGRGHDDFRNFSIEKLDENNYEGIVGETRVAVSIQSIPFKPERGRQNRGDVVVQLTYMPSAARANMDQQVNRARVRAEEALQSLFRSSGVIDTRFLLIEQYEAALQLIIRVQVINDSGGLIDAAIPAAVVALANYKVPKHKYEDGVFKKISINAEWPEKLRVFCHAYVVTFALFGDTFIADPDERECLYADGFVRIGVTDKSMVYAIREDGDQVRMTKEKMMKLCELSLQRAKQLDSHLATFFKDSRLL